jgi:adenine/guanine phosphoribosyltransferase-like PRPP-binding protein
MTTKLYDHAAYLDILRPDRLEYRFDCAKDAFKTCPVEFDTIAFSGCSGTMFGPILALHLNKEMILVRKEQDCPSNNKRIRKLQGHINHSQRRVEGYTECKRYIIVDDQVSMGDTVKRMAKEIRAFAPEAQCVAVYQYFEAGFLTPHQGGGYIQEIFQPPAKSESAVGVLDALVFMAVDEAGAGPSLNTDGAPGILSLEEAFPSASSEIFGDPEITPQVSDEPDGESF